jgi:hypothetical protein
VDVLHGLLDNVHLGELPVRGGGGDHAPQRLKALVDGEDAVALARVSLHGLEVLGRSNGVAVHRVEGHQARAGRHCVRARAQTAIRRENG